MTLAELEDTAVDMFTTVFSATRHPQVSGRMVTPRGIAAYECCCFQRHYRGAGASPAPLRRWALPSPSAWQPTWGRGTGLRRRHHRCAPGRLDAEGMTALLRGAALCVDATHPYAAEATRNIRAAAAAAGVEYHRLLRPASPLPAGSVVLADAARAAAYLADRPGRVLLATGAKELPAFAALDPARLYPRVLPTLAGIAACEAAGIPHRNILAMQGPFTKELNAALLHQFHIDYMVTKDGGAAGGFAEKVEAAARCGVQLIVLRRPDDEGETADTILQRCRELL